MTATTKQTLFQKVTSILRPSLTELLFMGGFIIAMFLFAATTAYLEELAVVAEVQNLFSAIAEKIGIFLDTPLVTNIVTIFFWALIGLIIFSLVWSMLVVLMDVKNDIVVAEYFVHPRSFHKSDFLLAAISRRVILVTAYAIIAVYAYLLLRSLPIVFESIRNLFLQDKNNLAMYALTTTLALGSWILGWHLILVVRRFSVSLLKDV
jgi:hypothetical protein